MKKACRSYNTSNYLLSLKSVLILSACFLFSMNHVYAQVSLDDQVLIEMMEHRGHEPTELQQALSNSTNYVSMAVPVAFLAKGIIGHDKISLQKGWYITKSLIVSSLVTTGLKYAVNRERPFLKNSFIIPAGSAGSPSFPSGHTSEAFSTATALSLACPRWYVIAPSALWACSVGYSRMYLGVHYPSDVIAGAALGMASAWLTYKFTKWMHPVKKQVQVDL